MAKLTNQVIEPPKIVLAGPAGCGKTALATTLGSNCQVLDFDKGLRTCLNLKDINQSARGAIDYIPCYEDEITKATGYQRGKDHLIKTLQECQKKTYPFKALIVDSFTTLSDMCLRAILGASGKLSTNLATLKKNPEIQEWGLFITEMENFLSMIKALPIPVILIAHTIKDEGTKEIELSIPTKKLPPKIPTMFDELWYLKVVDTGAGARKYLLETVKGQCGFSRSRASLENNLDVTSLSMVEILRRIGWDFAQGKGVDTTPTKP